MPASSQPNADADGDPLAQGAIVAQLHRVLESESLAAAPRSRDLITFVVTETLAGRGEALNERLLARLALDRPSTVDTRRDSSGRVQASRARALLERYYSGEGRDDAIRIAIPSGQYSATFSRSPHPRLSSPIGAAAGTATVGPLVAVANLAHGGTSRERQMALGLSESMVRALS